jgi:tetratricopeptide (TPR) repeat protein
MENFRDWGLDSSMLIEQDGRKGRVFYSSAPEDQEMTRMVLKSLGIHDHNDEPEESSDEEDETIPEDMKMNVKEFHLAVKHVQNGNYQEGLEIALKLNEDEDLADHDKCSVLDIIGQCHVNLEQYIETILFSNELLVLIANTDISCRKLSAMIRLAHSYLQIGNFNECLEIGQEVINMLNKDDDDDARVTILSNMMGASIKSRQFQNALKYAIEMLELEQKLARSGDKCTSSIIFAYEYVGKIYLYLGDLKSALKYFKLALGMVKADTRMNDAKCRILHNIGIIFKKHGNLKQAMKVFRKISQTKKSMDDLEDKYQFCRYLVTTGACLINHNQCCFVLVLSQFPMSGFEDSLEFVFSSLKKILDEMEFNPEDVEVFLDKLLEVYSNSIECQKKIPKGFRKHFPRFKNSKRIIDTFKNMDLMKMVPE